MTSKKEDKGNKESKTEDSGGKRIDLGLNAIVASQVSSQIREPQVHSLEEGLHEKDLEKGLEQQSRWDELAHLCESKLEGVTEGSEDYIRYTLLWVKAQLKGEGVPLNVLAAPLEKAAKVASEAGLESKDLRSEAISLLDELACDLELKDEKLLAASLRERLASISNTDADPTDTPSKKDDEVLVDEKPVVDFLEIETRDSGLQFKFWIYLFSFLLLLSGFLFYLFTSRAGGSFQSDISLTQFRDRAPLLPWRLTKVEKVSSLDEILYQIEGDASRTKPSIAPSTPVATVPEKQTTQKQVAQKTVSAKETINTTTPVAGTQFKFPYKELPPQKGVKKNDGDPAGFFKKDEVGVAKPSEKDKKTELAGRYRILVQTRVVARPSYLAVTVGALQPGDEVFVSERQGDWLVIESKKGKPGYILAQDAERVRR